MCLWFACFGLHKHDDDCYAPPNGGLAATKPHHHGHAHYYGNGAHHHHQTAAADEAGRKASNDARKGPAAVARDDAPLAHAATVTQQPPWNGRVAGEAGHGHGAQQPQHYYNYNYYERQPVQREDAMDRHYYTTATATADHERY